ncbi:hypothetical protein ACU4GG_00890 [Streptomyces nojiriensis]
MEGDEKRLLGLGHIGFLTTAHNLAPAHHTVGQLGNAIRPYRKVLILSAAVLGEEDPLTQSAAAHRAAASAARKTLQNPASTTPGRGAEDRFGLTAAAESSRSTMECTLTRHHSYAGHAGDQPGHGSAGDRRSARAGRRGLCRHAAQVDAERPGNAVASAGFVSELRERL